jgi:hypothetical protein
MKKIIVIGLNQPEDLYTLFRISEWLDEHRPGLEVGERIRTNDVDLFDMTTLPEKGDALDYITTDTQLVIALHLFGIDMMPGGTTAKATELHPQYCYNRDNINLLPVCMNHRAPLISVGDQPWLGLETRALMFGSPTLSRRYAETDEPLIYIYEPRKEPQ